MKTPLTTGTAGGGAPRPARTRRAQPREEGWLPVRLAPDFDTTGAMRAELRASGAVFGQIAGVLRDLEARLGRRSLLLEEEPAPELEAAVAEAASHVQAVTRACC